MFGSVVNKLAASVRRLLSPYAVGSFEPALAYDFVNGTYRTNNTTQSPEAAFTHTRSGNATMVDSDGLLKWGPHNLLTYSEDFTGWVIANATLETNALLAPDGTMTATTMTSTGDAFSDIDFAIGGSGGQTDFGIWVKKASTLSTILIGQNNLAERETFNLTDEWQKIKNTRVAGSDRLIVAFPNNSSGESVHIWGAHLYRSDLGGMVNNPATGDSYVPTTSSARYLPRIGNHIYNGSAWVNEGLLHESEARTNLVTYSDLSSGFSNVQLTRLSGQAVGPDGKNSLALYTLTTATNVHEAYTASIAVTDGAVYTHSIIVKKGTLDYFGLRHYRSQNNWATAVFDLSTLSVSATSVGTSSGAISSTNIEDIGGGLYRLSLSASAAGTQGIFTFQAHSSGTPTLNTFGGDVFTGASETFYAGFGQMEQASTPSSYIPTSGSTVTRAADVLTIPAANMPWPQPQYIGPELVTNGTFDTDSNWTKGTGWSISGGTASHSGGVSSGLTQSISASAGKVYQITVDISDWNESGIVTVQLYGGGGSDSFTASSNGSYTKFITATVNRSTFGVFSASGWDGSIDNISVREINPLSVSIQMDGTMTYADENLGNQYVLLSWIADSANVIVTNFETNPGTGGVEFVQLESSVVDIVETTSSYSPGINVPYNIASRHGSTFINGAVDGTALTANTTPKALPDLSSTDLSLASTYMGNIGTFRVWSQDIGDDGIAAVTAPSLEPSLSLTFDSTESSFIVEDWT